MYMLYRHCEKAHLYHVAVSAYAWHAARQTQDGEVHLGCKRKHEVSICFFSRASLIVRSLNLFTCIEVKRCTKEVFYKHTTCCAAIESYPLTDSTQLDRTRTVKCTLDVKENTKSLFASFPTLVLLCTV